MIDFAQCAAPMDAVYAIEAKGTEIVEQQLAREEDVDIHEFVRESMVTAIQHFSNRALLQQRAGTVPHMADDVRRFMRMAGQPLPEKPGWPSVEVLRLRRDMLNEEMLEFTIDLYNRDFPGIVDNLLDIIYVAIGGLLDLGVDPTPIWKEVQRANMAKAGGPIVNGKLKKPEGWTPPDIEGELREQGWEA